MKKPEQGRSPGKDATAKSRSGKAEGRKPGVSSRKKPDSGDRGLRLRAEKILRIRTEKLDATSPADVKRLIHELGTHQIELEIQNEELREAQLELEASRRRYADLYDFAPIGYFTLDQKGRILETNVTGAGMLGVSKRLLVNSPLTRFIPDIKDRWTFAGHCAEVLNRRLKNICEIRLRRKNGEAFFARLESAVSEDGGGAGHLIRTTVSDVSDRRQAEDLANHLASFPLLNPNPVLETELSGKIVYANPSTEQFLESRGFGRTDTPLFLPRDFGAVLRTLREKTDSVASREVTIGDRIFNESIKLLPHLGVARIYCHDITERVQAEEALKKSEERFRLMAETSSDVIFQVDLSGRVTYCSPAVHQFGYLPAEIIGTHFPDYVAPAYVPKATEAFRQAIAERRLAPFDIVVLKKDGSTATLEISVAPVLHEGLVSGVQGIARDITERKRIDSELRKARAELEIRVRERTAELSEKTIMLEDSLRETEDLYQNAPCGYHSIDADGVILRVNNTELKWLGYSREEVIGKMRFADLMTPESLQVYQETFPIFKKRGWVKDLEFTVSRRDGTPLTVLLNSDAIFGDKGQFVMSRSTLFDITERKETQRKETLMNELLKLFSKTFRRRAYLDSVVNLLKNWCMCECIGIRLAERDGSFPYAASAGFSSEFLEKERSIAVGKDSCACTRIFRQRPEEAEASHISPEGSFVCNDLSYLQDARKKNGTASYRGTCAAHGFTSLAVIPVRYRNVMKGVIHLADRRGAMFPEKVIAMMESMTPLIGEALQRFDMEAALKASREQLRSLSSHLQAAREEERLRLAREIHDDLGQTLTAAIMELGLLRKEPRTGGAAMERLESVAALIDEAIEDIQRICAELRPRMLDHLGLRAAIEWSVKKFTDRTGINCILDAPHDPLKLSPATETALFRIFQETLTNVSRHAEATQVSIRLGIEDNNLVLEVSDNGKGASRSKMLGDNAFGIIGIRERTHELGGEVTFTSTRHKGTTVRVKVPHERGTAHV